MRFYRKIGGGEVRGNAYALRSGYRALGVTAGITSTCVGLGLDAIFATAYVEAYWPKLKRPKFLAILTHWFRCLALVLACYISNVVEPILAFRRRFTFSRYDYGVSTIKDFGVGVSGWPARGAWWIKLYLWRRAYFLCYLPPVAPSKP